MPPTTQIVMSIRRHLLLTQSLDVFFTTPLIRNFGVQLLVLRERFKAVYDKGSFSAKRPWSSMILYMSALLI